MAITELIFGAPTMVEIGNPIPVLGVIQFDCSVSEVHSGEAEITDHPVEAAVGAGSVISDHIRVMPEAIEINGLVTNTPLVFLASLTAPSPVFPFVPTPLLDRVDEAYKTLQKLKNAGSLLDIVTSLRTYSSMAISSLVINRNAQTGNVLDCTVGLREVITATSLALESPIPDDVANQAAAAKAKLAKAEASASQSSTAQSTLSSLLGGLI